MCSTNRDMSASQQPKDSNITINNNNSKNKAKWVCDWGITLLVPNLWQRHRPVDELLLVVCTSEVQRVDLQCYCVEYNTLTLTCRRGEAGCKDGHLLLYLTFANEFCDIVGAVWKSSTNIPSTVSLQKEVEQTGRSWSVLTSFISMVINCAVEIRHKSVVKMALGAAFHLMLSGTSLAVVRVSLFLTNGAVGF